MSDCKVCGHEGCEKGCLPYPTAWTGSAPRPCVWGPNSLCPGDCPACADTACDCPADDYLTLLRIAAQEVDALERELDDVRATLHDVLDHVKWDSIPQQVVNDIDAIFDGNTDDTDSD